MTVVMVSNFLNHHQLPLCLAFQAMEDVEFTFVVTTPMEEERVRLGYADMNHGHAFVLRAYEDERQKAEAERRCLACDVLIIGSAPMRYAEGRTGPGKITFFYSERLFKETGFSVKTLPRIIKYALRRGLYRRGFLLCASAFAAQDYAHTGSFVGRAFKWGYFPEVLRHEPDELMSKKVGDTLRLLWVGRMIGWKHPEAAIETALRLKDEGYDFRVDMIGTGALEDGLRGQIQKKGLTEQVCLTGAMPPEQVRRYMEQADIFLFTSDRNEGWGAVLNEAMNSGCAVVAADEIGSAPYLVEDGTNGLLFRSGDWNDLYAKVKRLADDGLLRERLGRAAYASLAEQWNAETAAPRLIELAKALFKDTDTPFTSGPCSRA